MIPCKTCLKYSICINKKMPELLCICPDLKKFMSEGLDNFDIAIDFLFKPKERDKHEKIEKEKD